MCLPLHVDDGDDEHGRLPRRVHRSLCERELRACRHEHVTVLSTDLEFRRYEVGLRRWMVRSFGRDRWSLYVDADELFDYPGSDRLPLPGLLGYLEARGYKAMAGQMLDLFSDKSFSRLATDADGSLQQEYRHYDLTDLIRTQDVYWIRDGQLANPAIPCYFGGIRKRFFGDDCLLLTKHPLVFADAGVGVYTYDGHFVTRAPVADVSAALLHYKYIGSLPERVRVTVDEQWHNKVAALYGGLADALSRDPDLCLRLPTARELRDIDELVDNGFLHVTPAYLDWVEAHGRALPRVGGVQASA